MHIVQGYTRLGIIGISDFHYEIDIFVSIEEKIEETTKPRGKEPLSVQILFHLIFQIN